MRHAASYGISLFFFYKENIEIFVGSQMKLFPNVFLNVFGFYQKQMYEIVNNLTFNTFIF